MIHSLIPGKRIAIIMLVASAVSFYSCHSSKHHKSVNRMPGLWQAQPIIVDGDSKDWPSPYPNYDSKGMIGYATSNDAEYLYVTMQTGDDLTMLKILKAGMIVSIDTSGDKKPVCNINYPLADQNTEPLDLPHPEKNQKVELLVQELQNQIKKQEKKGIESATQFSLDGFINCNGGYMISQTTPCGIKIKASIDEYKELVWEAAIPFRAIYGDDKITAAQAGKPIGVCFTIRAIKKPKSVANDNTSSSMGNGAGGGMGGSRGGGGRGGGSGRTATQDPMEHLYETTKTWKEFGLAWH